ncbi:MAG TPA: DEAD/DEAH box helicase family protein [Saprospiraceae bacterium]|nr:DEAD/DEAH box helicase family protein [Saprospiraceae bacterium]HMP22631.1 DEAD/DEAH box helicase family protein [Saprospiraceae bacterium]
MSIYQLRVPKVILDNLNPRFELRPYQLEAMGRFVTHWSGYRREEPLQLLYHMATGSGKTIVMAGLIIYLYQQGYRNFLFFVNSTNIIDKTRDNFLNSAATKYLFAASISIEGQPVHIREVSNFQIDNQLDINIIFTTIQGLHARLHTPRENNLTADDFANKKIVLISDEAHHINAETKQSAKLNNEEQAKIISWEGTVNTIFRSNPANILLEFTATADLSVPEIASKYQDKLIFDYPLRQFRRDGYSKEIKVLQSDLPAFERALQAVLLSQHRRKLFEQHGQRIKPVILFKSKTIKESRAFFADFIYRMKHLQVNDLEKIQASGQHTPVADLFTWLAAAGIGMEPFIMELQSDFSEDKILIINSKEESEQSQLIINSLEDEANSCRAIFAVDKLNEGWDVLNLFDIVRLYDTRDASGGQPGKTTISEAQLIGRGARYCPFCITTDQPLYQRKYDTDIHHIMRLCEELYYHSAYNPRYIQELNSALQATGLLPKRTKEVPIRLKAAFKTTDFYQHAVLWLNERPAMPQQNLWPGEQHYRITLKTGHSFTTNAFESVPADTPALAERTARLNDFAERILRKAINQTPFYYFDNLKKYLPALHSISEFITSKHYAGQVQVTLIGQPEQLKQLAANEQLMALKEVLTAIANAITKMQPERRGSATFRAYSLKDRLRDKVLRIGIDEHSDALHVSETKSDDTDWSQREWYALEDNIGTAIWQLFMQSFAMEYASLQQNYDIVYLVPTKHLFIWHNIANGKAMHPDFTLFLANQQQQWQVFIHLEPGRAAPEKKMLWQTSHNKTLHTVEALFWPEAAATTFAAIFQP